jgi:beta-mannosidase
MIDFYGERKLAFYAVKRESAPLVIGLHRSTPDLKRLKSPPPRVPGAPHDLSKKDYIFDIWAVNTTLQEITLNVELRLFDTETGNVLDKNVLERQVLPSNRSMELMADQKVDDRTAIQAIARDIDGRVIARASDWPQPLKHVHLPTSYDVKLRILNGKVEVISSAPVKSLELYITDENRHITWGDNGLDVFPGDVYVIDAEGLLEGDNVGVRYYGMEWIPNRRQMDDISKSRASRLQ